MLGVGGEEVAGHDVAVEDGPLRELVGIDIVDRIDRVLHQKLEVEVVGSAVEHDHPPALHPRVPTPIHTAGYLVSSGHHHRLYGYGRGGTDLVGGYVLVGNQDEVDRPRH